MLYKYRGKIKVYESDTRGVFPILFKNWKRKNDEIYILDLKELIVTYDRMEDKVGKRYDFFAIIRHLTNWFGWRKSKNAEKRMTCYEYLGYCYDLNNWYKLRPIDVEKNMKKL